MKIISLALALTTTMTSVACQQSANEPASSPSQPSAPSPTVPPSSQTAHAPGNMPVMPTGHPQFPFDPTAAAAAPAGTLGWDDPAAWHRVPPSSPMRRAQLQIPHVASDTADAELVVITFGPGQGGDTNANLERWYGQVVQPDGRATRDVAVRTQMTVGALNVTLVDVAGRIASSAMAMTAPGAPPPPSFEHGRLLAAIVETPAGPWFFKITGPDATVSAAHPAFEALLQSLRFTPGAGH